MERPRVAIAVAAWRRHRRAPSHAIVGPAPVILTDSSVQNIDYVNWRLLRAAINRLSTRLRVAASPVTQGSTARALATARRAVGRAGQGRSAARWHPPQAGARRWPSSRPAGRLRPARPTARRADLAVARRRHPGPNRSRSSTSGTAARASVYAVRYTVGARPRPGFSGGLKQIHFAAGSRSTRRHDPVTSDGGILIHQVHLDAVDPRSGPAHPGRQRCSVSPRRRDQTAHLGLRARRRSSVGEGGPRPSWWLSSRSEPGVKAAKRLAQRGKP